jgi:HEAT repeat protein
MNIRNIVGFVFLVLLLAVAGYALAAEPGEKELERAREALNKQEYEHAIQLLEEVYEKERDREVAGDALYWQAFARYRLQKTKELKIAAELLRLQQEEYKTSATAAEGEALLARLYGELARRGEAQAVREIHELSEDEMQREATRVAALESLMRMDPDKARPILEKIVTGEKEAAGEMRRNAIFLMCRMEDQQSEDTLIRLMQTSEDPELLSEVVMCLSMRDSDRALEAIIDLFHRVDDRALDEAAMFAIGRHGGDKAFAMLAGVVRDPESSTELRQQALFSLGQSGRDQEVADIAVEILKSDQDPQMLETALFSLSRLEGDIPDQVYMDLINNPQADEQLRAQALFLAAQRSELSLEFLRAVYDQTDSRQIKLQVLNVITHMEDEETGLEALIEIVRRETDPEIRQNAVFWIGQYDNERAAEFLLEVINQE